jgi:hypothetical protein
VPLTANIEQPALQRARGAVDLVVKAGKLERFYQSGSAKMFLPKTYAQTYRGCSGKHGWGANWWR